MEKADEYSIFASESFPLLCSFFVLLYGTIYSAYRKKTFVAFVMTTAFVALLYGASLTREEQIAQESSYTGMSHFELDPCTVPIEKFFIFNISEALAVKCEEYDNFEMRADDKVEEKLARWALAFFDIYIENTAFSNFRKHCEIMDKDSRDYAFFNCSRRRIAPENVPGFLAMAPSYLPRTCALVPPEPVPTYNMRYTNANCPMRFMRPYVFSISLLALVILSPISLFYGEWI